MLHLSQGAQPRLVGLGARHAVLHKPEAAQLPHCTNPLPGPATQGQPGIRPAIRADGRHDTAYSERCAPHAEPCLLGELGGHRLLHPAQHEGPQHLRRRSGGWCRRLVQAVRWLVQAVDAGSWCRPSGGWCRRLMQAAGAGRQVVGAGGWCRPSGGWCRWLMQAVGAGGAGGMGTWCRRLVTTSASSSDSIALSTATSSSSSS